MNQNTIPHTKQYLTLTTVSWVGGLLHKIALSLVVQSKKVYTYLKALHLPLSLILTLSTVYPYQCTRSYSGIGYVSPSFLIITFIIIPR